MPLQQISNKHQSCRGNRLSHLALFLWNPPLEIAIPALGTISDSESSPSSMLSDDSVMPMSFGLSEGGG
jgi:hypothetical protein